MDYVTKSQVEQYMGIQIDDTLDTFLDLLSGYAKQYIDSFVSTRDVGRRWFDAEDTETTRYFDGNGKARIYIDDVRSISALVASITVGSGITLTANQDYFLYPLNALADGKPYEWIELANPAYNLPANSRLQALGGSNAYTFYEGQRNIAVTGKFGYNAAGTGIPKQVQVAALKIIAAAIKENIGDSDLKELTAESLGEYSASYAKVSEVADRIGASALLADFVRQRKSITSGTTLLS